MVVDDKIIFDHPWMKVFKNPRGFVFSERKGKDSIAVLPYRKVDGQKSVHVLVRLQPLMITQGTKLNMKCIEYGDVPREALIRCPITGHLDGKHDDLVDYAIEEMDEEAGISVDRDDIEPMGYYYVGTQTNEVVHCFMCDVTGKTQEEPRGDGQYYESISKNEWCDLSKLVKDIDSIHYAGLLILIEMLTRKIQNMAK